MINILIKTITAQNFCCSLNIYICFLRLIHQFINFKGILAKVRDTQRCVRISAGFEFKTSYCRLSRPFCSVDRAPEEHTVCVCKFHLFFVEPSLIRQVSFPSKLILDHPWIKLAPYFFGGRHYFFEKHRPKVNGPNVTARCLPRLHPHALSFSKDPYFSAECWCPRKLDLPSTNSFSRKVLWWPRRTSTHQNTQNWRPFPTFTSLRPCRFVHQTL